MSALFDQRVPARSSRIIAWLLRWRLWILGAIGLAITVAELLEHPINYSHQSPFLIGETVLFIALLLIIAILLESTIRSEERKTHTYHILTVKHLLAQQLSTVEGWQELTRRLYEFASTLAPNPIVDLLIPNQDSLDLEIFTSRESGAATNRKADLREVVTRCQECRLLENNRLHAMQSCSISKALHSDESSNGYCLPIDIGNSQVAFLQINLAPSYSLSSEQVEILENISPDIAIALQIVQQRKELSEYLVANATNVTRREISHDLHDTLGQSLSYLRFKLDQFTRNDSLVEVSEIRPDLLQMHIVASESLELLRDTLDGLQTGNQPRLAIFLQEHGKSVCERSNFDFQFNSTGTPFPLTSSTLNQIYYVYREALNNIEKHSCAKQVNVNLFWGINELIVRIEDDGKGFNLESVQTDQHYGIKIMQERMAALNGSILIDTSEGVGTRLTINLPLVA